MQETSFVKQAFPDGTLTEDVRQQTRSAAQVRFRHYQHRSRMRRALFGAVATIGLIIGGAVAGPPAYAYLRFQRIAGSVDDCQTAILTRYRISEDGRMVQDGKVFYSNGKWRLEDSSQKTVQIFADQILWIYSPESKSVLRMPSPEGPFGYNPTGFSLRAMLADRTRWNWSSDVTIGTETVDGKVVESLTMKDDQKYRTRFLADPETHMPFHTTTQVLERGAWRDVYMQTFVFNSRIDPQLFALRFPPGVKVVDRETVKKDWAQRLEKPMATIQAPSGKIVIRDIAVNQRGHIFLVFTDGQTVRQRLNQEDRIRRRNLSPGWHVLPTWEITDSLGNRYYQSSSLQPYMGDSPAGKDWIVLKDSQVPQGVWLIPAEDKTWRARAITFRCTLYSSGEKTSTWSMKFDHPTVPLIPEWFVACALAPISEKELLREEDQLQKNNGHMTVDIR